MADDSNIRNFGLRIILQAFIFVGALSVRDTLQATFNLIPVPAHNIWWKWSQTILHLLLIILIVWCMLKFRIVNSSNL